MFSDEVIGLSMRYDAELRENTRNAQLVVDQQDRRIIALQRKLAAAYAELELERGKRRALEIKLDRILSMPV